MIVRRCNKNDILSNKKSLYVLLEQCLDTSFDLGEDKDEFISKKISAMIQYVSTNAIIYIACEHESVDGFIWAYPVIGIGEMRLHIAYVAVLSRARGQGIGKKLINAIQNEAINLGIQNIELNVSVENVNAMGFYNNMHFYSERVLLVKKVED